MVEFWINSIEVSSITTLIFSSSINISSSFLRFSKSRGNDLSTPRPEFNFPGLAEGDSWCVCAERWKEAYEHGFAPKVFLKRTHKKATSIIDIEVLKEYAVDLN